MTKAVKFDIYEAVTNRIIEMLEKGVRPWAKSWKTDGVAHQRPLRATGQPYRGINVLLLWGAAIEKGFKSPYWMTYKQAETFKGQVRKGEKSTMVVYYTRIEKFDKDDLDKDGKPKRKVIPILRFFNVFNADQIENLPARFQPKPVEVDESIFNKESRIDDVEAFLGHIPADIGHGGSRAYFDRSLDRVQMPAFEDFDGAVSYYGTLFHELTHWTGHDDRLKRTFGNRFGDANYAREELVAELGAAFVCADLGLSVEPREDHAAYLSHWLSVLKEDKKAIFQASTLAQAAHDHLLAYQPGAVAADEEELEAA